jgi:TRAP-type C4-dicarboxylate transport system permease small subunit
METRTMDTTMQPERPHTPTLSQRFGGPSVWFAFLGGPLAWTAHLLISYGLVYVPCAVRLPLLLLGTLVMAAVAIAAAVVSWRFIQRSPAQETDAPMGGRNRFVGYAGLLNSILFLLIILAQGVTPLVLGGCG